MKEEVGVVIGGAIFGATVTKTAMEVVSSAVGALCEPMLLRRLKIAELEVRRLEFLQQLNLEILREKANGVIAVMRARAAAEVEYERVSRQINLENIGAIAIDLIGENPVKPSDNWITSFRKACQDTSAEDMQEFWARLLAGELNSPGSFSLRTVHFLSTTSSQEAKQIKSVSSLVSDSKRIYLLQGRSYMIPETGEDIIPLLEYFVSLGLLQPRNAENFPQSHRLSIGTLEYAVNVAGGLRIEFYDLTLLGREVMKFAGGEPNFSYLEKSPLMPSLFPGWV